MNKTKKRLTYRVNTGIQDVVLTDGKSVEECLEWKDVLDRLAEYEDLEEQEMLLKRPCKVGDTVYKVHRGIELVYECKVVGIKQEHNTLSVKLYTNINEKTYSIWVDDWFDECQIGRAVFLTQEAAEFALRNIEKDE